MFKRFHKVLGERPARRRRDDLGVSLAELAVTCSILAIIITTSGVAFDGWIKTAQTNQDRTLALEEGRLLVERVSKELRMATGSTETRMMAIVPNNCSTNPLQTYGDTYTLVEASDNSIAFYKVSQDKHWVKVRFARNSANRMTISTLDMSANGAVEVTSTVGTAGGPIVVNGKNGSPPYLFQYMSDTVSPLAGSGGYLTCKQLTQVSVVNIYLYLDKDPAGAIGASTIETSIFIRSTGYWK